MKFRKKPVVIEAEQLNRQNYYSLLSWCNGKVWTTEKSISIPTLEGNMVAELGDYIIKGVKDEFYPCKPDIFELTYEPITKTRT